MLTATLAVARGDLVEVVVDYRSVYSPRFLGNVEGAIRSGSISGDGAVLEREVHLGKRWRFDGILGWVSGPDRVRNSGAGTSLWMNVYRPLEKGLD